MRLFTRTSVLVATVVALLPHAVQGKSKLSPPLRQISHASDISFDVLSRAEDLHGTTKQQQQQRRSGGAPSIGHDDAFVLTFRAFEQEFKLHMEPNDELVHPEHGLTVRYGPNGDGSAERIETLARDQVRAYRGYVLHPDFSHRRKREDEARLVRRGDIPTSMWLQEGVMGWASILLHDDGLTSGKPSFEGAFGWTGNYHTIQTAETYTSGKQDLDPEPHKRALEENALVIHRKSDVMSQEELLQGRAAASEVAALSCSSDNLSYNTAFDPHPEAGFFEATPTLQRRRNLRGMWAGLADVSPRSLDSDSLLQDRDSALLETTLIARSASASSFDYDAWKREESLRRRQSTGNDIAGSGANSSYAAEIGSRQGCPNAARVVYMGVASDCTYTARFANESAVRTTILNNMNTVSNLYRSTFNISLGVIDLLVQPSNCPSNPSGSEAWNRGCANGYTLDNRLSDFSSWRGSRDPNGTGLWHLMTACASGNSEIGVAWLGTVCQTSSQNSDGSSVSSTGVSSATSRDWEVMAHEIGHNFGAIHDCTNGCSISGGSALQNGQSACCPASSSQCNADGSFIMNPVSSASAGSFSQCSIGNVCTLLGRGLGRECIVSPGQRTTLSNQQCGNGILEPGEECDAGPQGSACCTTQCRLTQGSVCDPLASACCTQSCQFASNTTVCRAALDDRCDTPETCSGTSAECPADVHKKDGDGCGSGLTCASGRCTSRNLQCQQAGSSLNLTRACPTSTSSGCSVACLNPQGGNSCLILQQTWVDGTECASGRCQNGRCVAGDWQETFRNWYRSNLQIAIPVTIVVAILVFAVLGCLIRCCFRRNPAKTAPSNRYSGVPAAAAAVPNGGRSRRSQRRSAPPPPPMQQQQYSYAPPPMPPPAVNYPSHHDEGLPPPIPPRQQHARSSSGSPGWVNTRDYNGY